MRTGAAAGHRGYYHQALCYDSDEGMVGSAVPFLTGGVEAGEPSVVALDDRKAALVRNALPAGSPVVFLADGATYSRPATAIRSYRKLLADHVAEGAGQIRIFGEVPALGEREWDAWARYESAINHAFDDFPLWSMCTYDMRTASEQVLSDVLRTHPRAVLPGPRQVTSETFVEPPAFLALRRAVVADPLQAATPRVELINPTPAEARRAVRATAPAALSLEVVDDLEVAVSETVTNAHRYGLLPAGLRLWTDDARVVVEVTDRGTGPKNPFAGLLPVGGPMSAGGFGLWITHQSCDQVTLHCDDDRFSVRLIVG